MADITVTIPNSTFTIDTISNGIEVTTPTSVEVNVDSNSNTIDITNTPQEITILTSGTLNITTTGITSVNGNAGPVVVLTTTNITEGTNLYFTDARVESHVFSEININNLNYFNTATLTTSTTSANQVIDSFTAAAYRTAKYIISITSSTDYQSVELLVVHNGTTASQTTYADVVTNASLAAFSVDISGGNVRLLTTPTNAVTVYKVAKTAIVV